MVERPVWRAGTGSLASWLRTPPGERQTRGSIPACGGGTGWPGVSIH